MSYQPRGVAMLFPPKHYDNAFNGANADRHRLAEDNATLRARVAALEAQRDLLLSLLIHTTT